MGFFKFHGVPTEANLPDSQNNDVHLGSCSLAYISVFGHSNLSHQGLTFIPEGDDWPCSIAQMTESQAVTGINVIVIIINNQISNIKAGWWRRLILVLLFTCRQSGEKAALNRIDMRMNPTSLFPYYGNVFGDRGEPTCKGENIWMHVNIVIQLSYLCYIMVGRVMIDLIVW